MFEKRIEIFMVKYIIFTMISIVSGSILMLLLTKFATNNSNVFHDIKLDISVILTLIVFLISLKISTKVIDIYYYFILKGFTNYQITLVKKEFTFITGAIVILGSFIYEWFSLSLYLILDYNLYVIYIVVAIPYLVASYLFFKKYAIKYLDFVITKHIYN